MREIVKLPEGLSMVRLGELTKMESNSCLFIKVNDFSSTFLSKGSAMKMCNSSIGCGRFLR
jgi:hypothetical protein